MNLCDDDSDELPLELVRRIDALCDDYEQRLAAGESVGLGDYLERIEPRGRRKLIRELVAVAAERLRSAGVADPGPAIIAQNPGLREEIEAALARFSDLGGAPLQPADGAATTAPLTPRGKKSRGLHIRCPHCSNPIELVGDTPVDSVNCTVCGSTFSLVDRSKETRLAHALQKIDRFELISRLGVGGFGTVWKARDAELDRTVAVKIPRQGQLSAAETEQFLREARAVAQLRHPNIVPVHEVGRDGDALFIVSDVIRGVSLADLLTGQRPTPHEAAQLCATVAAALDHAHRKGVIHRDLKPSNIMIDDEGTPYLMDFGLAKREAEEVTMTTEGDIIGTPAYMSPEQASGRSAWADRRTDVYSLGVVLFELLTGELPFRGNAQMQVHGRLHDDPPNVRTLNRHLPADLATICAKCLEREPGRRYQTAKDVADELDRFLARLPIHARPISRLARVARWAARRPWQAAVAGLVLLLAVAGPTAALIIQGQRMQLAESVAAQANLIKKREQETREAIGRSARLEDRLKLWEARANPWSLWPPDEGRPPKRGLFASLLAARGAALRNAGAADSTAADAQRLVTLATLHEQTGQHVEAERRLLEAVAALETLRRERPQSAPVALALADCYERLSVLTASRDRRDSNEWLARSLALRRSLAQQQRSDALVQALQLDAALRLAVAVGFEAAGGDLREAQQLEAQLAVIWPDAPADLYRLVCRLAGRTPWLDDPSLRETGPATAAGQ